MIKLLKGVVFFIFVSHEDTASQSDGSSQNSELLPPPVTVKLTSIEVYKKDLALLEESVKAAETHEVISAFQQFKIPMVSRNYTYACLQGACVHTYLPAHMYICVLQ